MEDDEEEVFRVPRRRRRPGGLVNVVLEDEELLENDDRNIVDFFVYMLYLEYDELRKRRDPFYNYDVRPVDASHACKIVVDVNAAVKQLCLKENSGVRYNYDGLLTFAVECSYRCCLQMFEYSGSIRNLYTVENHEKDGVATFAIDHYNKICENAKLELKEIVRINRLCRLCHDNYYVTLLAEDKNTGEVGLYQAAVAQHYVINSDDSLLGLLRECRGDKILAIVSLIGADEDMEKKRKELLLM